MPVAAHILIPDRGRHAARRQAGRCDRRRHLGRGRDGPCDVIVRAEARSVEDLARMVVSHIQLIEGITRTVTCPVVNL